MNETRLVLELKGSKFGSNEWRPNRVLIFEDRIEEQNAGFLGRGTLQTVRYDQVAQVAMQKGLTWATLLIETVGGGSIVVKALSRRDAERGKMEIDQRVARARGGTAAQPPDLPAQIAQLASLRDQGALTEAEFEAAKKSLLNP